MQIKIQNYNRAFRIINKVFKTTKVQKHIRIKSS
jgi:hypothetical protein